VKIAIIKEVAGLLVLFQIKAQQKFNHLEFKIIPFRTCLKCRLSI